MSSVHTSSSSAAPPVTGRSLSWLIAGVALLSFGGMLLVMAVAFARDLRALQDAPGLLWSALCGAPTQSELALPLLLVVGTTSCVVGAAALVIARLRR